MIWVVVDRLTKTTHFIPEKSTYSVDKWANRKIESDYQGYVACVHTRFCWWLGYLPIFGRIYL